MKAGLVLIVAVFCLSAHAAPRPRPPRVPITSFNLDEQSNLDGSLREAVRDNDGVDVAEFLRKGARIDAESEEGFTALMYAAQRCHPESAKELLVHKARTRKRDNMGRTALVHSIRSACLPVVRMLIRVSGDLSVKDKSGKSPYDYAMKLSVGEVDGDEVEILELIRGELLRTGSAVLRKDASSMRWDASTRKWKALPSPAPSPSP